MPQGEASAQVGGRLGAPGVIVDGRYRLERLLGAGGFGEVWRATQEVEGAVVRPVALKLLDAPGASGTPRAGGSGGSTDGGGHRWLDEVRAVRDVRCDAIATIFDVGVSREPRMAFIAMELLEGATLDVRLKDGTVYWRRALAIARDIARALVACHAVGVSHCDLKPQNVFLGAGNKVFVLDFGVAALGGHGQRAPDAAAGEELFDMGATGAVSIDEMPDVGVPSGVVQTIFGTPGYIAPESFRGEPPGPPSDVFALGVCLYRMIAGRLPQRVDEAVATTATTAKTAERYQAALSSATAAGDLQPLAEVVPDCPAGVAALIDRLLRPDPDARPVADLVDAIDEVFHRPYGVPDPPYVGLSAFDTHRAGYIAGRDGDIDEVSDKLRDSRAVVLAGPSGCGKSSLAIAGVAHRLDEMMLDGTDGWRPVVLRPSQGAEALSRDVAGAARARSGGVGTVIVVDQLEEVLGLDDDARVDVCEALAGLALGTAPVRVAGRVIDPADPVRVIATCRDDLFGRVASLPELQRFPERNLFTVRGVEPNAMAEIALGPARAAGYRLEGGDTVVAEAVRIVAEDSGALPLVQFALTRWWEGRDREQKRLPRAVWQAIGGVEGALAEAAQKLHDGLDQGERQEMRTILVSMFRPDGTRVRIDESTLVEGAAARSVLDQLVERRLVTRHTRRDGGATLEVVHEALGRRWPLLHSWLDETRSERELIHDLRYDAERWRSAGRPRDLLWRGARLAAALSVRDRVGADAEFVDAARDAAGRQRWQRRGFAGLLAVVVAVAVIMVLSYLASNRERANAREAQATAEREKTKADTARNDAEKALARNIELRTQAESASKEALAAKKRAEAEETRANEARDRAEVEAAANDELRRKAEAAEADAKGAMQQAQREKAEADRQRELNRLAAERAEKLAREAEAQKKYAETAQGLHELARKRMERIEAQYDKLRDDHEKLQDKLMQCMGKEGP